MDKNPEDDFDGSDIENESDPFAEGEEDFFESSSSSDDSENNDFLENQPSTSNNSYSSSSTEGGIDKKMMNLTSDIPIQIVAVLGKKSVTVKEIVSLKMGQVVELNRLPNEAVDLVANGKLIAKGELVEIDGRLGLRILKIFD